MLQFKFVFPAAFLCLSLSYCKKDTVDTYDCTGVTATYTGQIKSILDASCAYAGCHGGSNPAEGIDLSNYTDAKSAAQKSSFLGSIQHKSGYEAMPQGGAQLDDSVIKAISCWVQNNMPE